MKRIYLYGLANAKEQYRVVWHSYIEPEEFSTKNVKAHAAWMRLEHPSVEHVYAISMRPGLARDYQNAVRRNTIESNVIFKDMLEREGLFIL